MKAEKITFYTHILTETERAWLRIHGCAIALDNEKLYNIITCPDGTIKEPMKQDAHLCQLVFPDQAKARIWCFDDGRSYLLDTSDTSDTSDRDNAEKRG